MPRFFINSPISVPSEYLLSGEPGRHAAKSLRLRPGESLTLCDGSGTDYLCQVKENLGDSLRLQVETSRPSTGEPHVKITVCQCLPKSDKLEAVVQKSVELGAFSLWPIESLHCVARWEEKAVEKKLARLQKIAQEAAMQSGRGIIPQVLPPAPLEQALRVAAGEGSVFFFYEKGLASLKRAAAGAGERIFLFVGPEGGFAPQEAELAASLGAQTLSLGPRILRAETAPIAALAAILYEKGEMEL